MGKIAGRIAATLLFIGLSALVSVPAWSAADPDLVGFPARGELTALLPVVVSILIGGSLAIARGAALRGLGCWLHR